MAKSNIGRVVQVIGVVVDCEFPPENLPEMVPVGELTTRLKRSVVPVGELSDSIDVVLKN